MGNLSKTPLNLNLLGHDAFMLRWLKNREATKDTPPDEEYERGKRKEMREFEELLGAAEEPMSLKPLASLAVEIAEGLRDEGSVIDLGQRYGLSALDLVLEGPSGNLAQGPLYDEACDFIPGHAATRQDMPIEQAADEIKEHVLPLRNWKSVAYKHDLKTIFLSIRRSVGAERRYLHTRGGNPRLPGDPLIMF